MPPTFDGDWLREHFPDIADSMDSFIDQVKAETNGELVGDLEITRIPLDVYHARNATSRRWHESGARPPAGQYAGLPARRLRDRLAVLPVHLAGLRVRVLPRRPPRQPGPVDARRLRPLRGLHVPAVAARLHAQPDDQAQQGPARSRSTTPRGCWPSCTSTDPSPASGPPVAFLPGSGRYSGGAGPSVSGADRARSGARHGPHGAGRGPARCRRRGLRQRGGRGRQVAVGGRDRHRCARVRRAGPLRPGRCRPTSRCRSGRSPRPCSPTSATRDCPTSQGCRRSGPPWAGCCRSGGHPGRRPTSRRWCSPREWCDSSPRWPASPPCCWCSRTSTGRTRRRSPCSSTSSTRSGTQPVLCVATVRSEEASAALRLLQGLMAARTATVLELDALATDDLGRMTAACLGSDDVPSGVVEYVRAWSDGLPFMVEEVLAGRRRRGCARVGRRTVVVRHRGRTRRCR